jgi:predicted GTPase
MLAGKPVAEVSDYASGCTTSNKCYSISHRDNNGYTFWDTPGLNEDREGSVSLQAAVQDLLQLVNDQGVNLLIYCIRGRLVNTIRVNYDLFWGIICKEKVPILLVVTGLEGKHDMDEWWRVNEKSIKKMKMVFAGHACITSWKGRENIYETVYEESAEKVWALVREHCRPMPWFMPPEWPNKARKEMIEYMVSYGLHSLWKFHFMRFPRNRSTKLVPRG